MGRVGFELKISRVFLCIAGVALAFMLLITLAEVVGRAFGRPILGVYEIVSFLGAVVIGFSIPYTSLLKGHVAVDFLIEKASRKNRAMMQFATRIVSIVLFLWMGWNFFVMSLDLIKSNEITQVLRVPYYPITFGLAFCCLIQCVALLSQIRAIVGVRHE